MSHQAPRITTPPSISLSLPPSTSTQLSITLSTSHYTFLYPTLSKLPTIMRMMRRLFPTHSLRFVLNFHLNLTRSRLSLTSGSHTLCYPPKHHHPSSLDPSLPSLSPLLTSPRPPVNQWVIKFASCGQEEEQKATLWGIKGEGGVVECRKRWGSKREEGKKWELWKKTVSKSGSDNTWSREVRGHKRDGEKRETEREGGSAWFEAFATWRPESLSDSC